MHTLRGLLPPPVTEAALIRKHSPASARARIFDGVAGAKLLALACSELPKGHAPWTLKLVATAVVEPQRDEFPRSTRRPWAGIRGSMASWCTSPNSLIVHHPDYISHMGIFPPPSTDRCLFIPC